MGDSYLRLTAVASSQHGVFSRTQALESGVTSTMLTRRTRNGALARPYEGVYVISGSAGTWERAVSAAVLGAGDGAAASHATACHLLDLARRPRNIEVSVPRDARPPRDFVIHRSTDLIESDVWIKNGIRCTTPARTLVDVGIPWGDGFAARCLDEAVRREMVTIQAVAGVLHRVARKGRNGVGPMRRVLIERVSVITEGVMEDEFLRIMKAAGVDLPECQVYIHRIGGRFIARVDFIYRTIKLVIALDGEAYHSDSKSFRRDRRQQNELVLEGHRVLRFTYFDLFAAPEFVVAQVVAALNQVF
ncbi:MAG: type IV toxin-antitoxin system AbiEi family antitoxin domain-containing protein [Acidimicrobiia bacterium]